MTDGNAAGRPREDDEGHGGAAVRMLGVVPGPAADGIRTRFANLLAGWADRLADRQPSPGGGADAPDAGRAGTGAGGGRPRWSRRRTSVVAALGILVVVVAAAMFAGSSDGGSDASATAPVPGSAPIEPYAYDELADSDGGSASGYGGDAARAAPLPPGVAADSSVSSTLPLPEPTQGGAARPPGAEPRIVRDGSASVEVRAGGVEEATRSLTLTVTGLGGYVEASEMTGTASTTDDRAQYGSVTLRVPADKFDELLGGLGEVGTVVSSTTSSQDVTGDYVDLEARIRALEASRATYLTLLTQADSVGDTLAVQQNIDSVQIQLEQIEGQRQVLEDATDLATLTVQVAEEGSPASRPEPEPSGIGAAFEKSWDRFVDGVEDVVAAIGPIVLFLLLLLLGYGAVRLALALYRRRHPAPAPTPASETPAPPAAQPSAAQPSAAQPSAPSPPPTP